MRIPCKHCVYLGKRYGKSKFFFCTDPKAPVFNYHDSMVAHLMLVKRTGGCSYGRYKWYVRAWRFIFRQASAQ